MENDPGIKAIIENVIKQLNDFYNGPSWVTYNLEKKVFSLTESVAFEKKPAYSHSIAEQVAHLTAWRNFALQKLSGNINFNITDDSEEDWPRVTDWNTVRDEFKVCHQGLIKATGNFTEDQWYATVPGRSYSFLYMINGIVQHDYYHYGQIGSLLAAIRKS